MKQVLLIFMLALCSTNLQAQVQQQERIEIDLKDEFYVKGLYNFGEHGVVLSAVEDLKRSSRDPKRMYIFYDNTLRELESIDVEVDFRRKLMISEEGEHNINTLYYDSRKGEYTVVRIDPVKISRKEFEGVIPSGLSVNGFKCIGDMAVIYASAKKNKLFLIVDLAQSEFRQIDFSKQKRSNKIFMIDMQTLPGEEEVSLTVQEYDKKIMLSTKVYLVNRSGEVSEPFELDAGRWNIVDATPTRVGTDQLIIAGTYSEMRASGAAGLFITSFKGGEQEYFNTHNFTDYEDFFSYLSKRGQDKMERRIEKKKSKGREVNLQIRMALHNIVQSGEYFFVLGEAYYPTYRTETSTTYINGRPTTTTTTVFDGYQYTHAVLSRFNAAGDKLEDYIFEMWPFQKPFYVKKFIEMNVRDELIKMAFVDGSVLKTRVLDQGALIEQDDVELIRENSSDRVRASSGTVEHFYGSSFISYGSQNIKNKEDRDVKRKRNVFFMQKIIIE